MDSKYAVSTLIEDVVFEKMPCQDCERAIAELRAEVDRLRAMVEQLRTMVERRDDAILDAMEGTVDKLKAEHQTFLASVKALVRETVARLEGALRMPPSPPAREDPPRWQ